LGNQTRLGKALAVLDDLPSKLDETYEKTMNRIKHRGEEDYGLALRVLSWISKARRPLHIHELQHALMVEPGDRGIVEGEPETEALIVSVCLGLISVDTESQTVRLVHFTVEEYFRKQSHKWFPGADKLLAETCLTYLSFDAFEQGLCADIDEFLNERLEKYSLLRYAAANWAHHCCLVVKDVEKPLRNFLNDERRVASAFEAIGKLYPYYFKNPYKTECQPGLHLLVKLKCESLVRWWLQSGAKIDAKNSQDRTALFYAVESRDFRFTRLLIEFGADVNATAIMGLTPLIIAALASWQKGLQLLLGAKAVATASNVDGVTSLHYAIRSTNSDNADISSMLDLLLEFGADIDARSMAGRTPLAEAAVGIFRANRVEQLLQRRASPNIKDNAGVTPLIMGAKHGVPPAAIKALLQFGADVNAIDSRGNTALMEATDTSDSRYERKKGSYETVELLLQAGAGAAINAVNCEGSTALTNAIKSSLLSRRLNEPKEEELANEVVALLLSSGVSESDIASAMTLVEAAHSPKLVQILSKGL
jgi:ankyrin repeat protein